MRRSLLKLVAVGLLALVFIQPPAPVSPPPPIVESSATPQTDWSGVARARDVRLFHETRFFLIAEEQQAKKTAQLEGNLGAQAEQEALQLDGDRFDRLAMCESTMDRYAVGGGIHFSYFQWLLSTWHAAGGEGDPRDSDYATQKAIAMSWAERTNPYTQWPQCWPRSAG